MSKAIWTDALDMLIIFSIFSRKYTGNLLKRGRKMCA